MSFLVHLEDDVEMRERDGEKEREKRTNKKKTFVKPTLEKLQSLCVYKDSITKRKKKSYFKQICQLK